MTFQRKIIASGLTSLQVEKILPAKLCKCTKKLTLTPLFMLISVFNLSHLLFSLVLSKYNLLFIINELIYDCV